MHESAAALAAPNAPLPTVLPPIYKDEGETGEYMLLPCFILHRYRLREP